MRLFLLLLVLLTPNMSNAEANSPTPYVSQEQFQLRGDKHEQARTWATCAALYNTMAALNQSVWNNPKQAEQFNNMGNGAEVAVGITFVVSALGTSIEEILQSRFNATWDFAKVAMKEMPSVVQTAINANIERGKKGTTAIKDEIQAIIDGTTICMKNVELQQTYIDIWRELATSGLLTLPKK